MRLGDHREACALLQDGVEQLQQAGSMPFAIRARKRLAEAYLRAWRPYSAFRELCTAYDMAEEYKVYGQITPLMEHVHEWGYRLRVWPRKTP